MNIRAVLKQHPVGHGGFHTQQFYLTGQTVPSVTVIYDCGATRAAQAEDAVRSFIDSFGDEVKRLDAIYLSHYDFDHVSGLEMLGARCRHAGITVTHVIAPYLTFEQKLAKLVTQRQSSKSFYELVMDPHAWFRRTLGAEYVHLARPSVEAASEERDDGDLLEGRDRDRVESDSQPIIDELSPDPNGVEEDPGSDWELHFTMPDVSGAADPSELIATIRAQRESGEEVVEAAALGAEVWRFTPWSLEELKPLSQQFSKILQILLAESSDLQSASRWFSTAPVARASDGRPVGQGAEGQCVEEERDHVDLVNFLWRRRTMLRGIANLVGGVDGSNRSSIVLDSSPVIDPVQVEAESPATGVGLLRGAKGGWLLTGDANLSSTERIEEMKTHLWPGKSNRVSVVSGPHHGSKFNSHRYLFETVRAEFVVVEVPLNSRRHPHADFVKLAGVPRRIFEVSTEPQSFFTLSVDLAL